MKLAQINDLQYLERPTVQTNTGGTTAPDTGVVDSVREGLYSISDFLNALWATWKPIALILSLLLITGIIYCAIRINQIRSEDKEHLKKLTLEAKASSRYPSNARWNEILAHMDSTSPNDWRLAILEADIMLDEMMSAMGYTQDTLGEKLKSVEESDFTTINEAWEAHKVRNQIAHQGSALELTQREAQRIVMLYEKVFKEFNYID